jgi:hypothetical protein
MHLMGSRNSYIRGQYLGAGDDSPWIICTHGRQIGCGILEMAWNVCVGVSHHVLVTRGEKDMWCIRRG